MISMDSDVNKMEELSSVSNVKNVPSGSASKSLYGTSVAFAVKYRSRACLPFFFFLRAAPSHEGNSHEDVQNRTLVRETTFTRFAPVIHPSIVNELAKIWAERNQPPPVVS